MFSKKTLLSVLIIGVIATVAGAGTWAAFSDTETSSGNTFTAGTLDLTLGASTTTGTDINNVYPGASGSKSWTLSNVGTIPGLLSLQFNVYDATEGTPTTINPAGDDTINEALQVQVLVDGNQLYSGSLAGLKTASLDTTALTNGGSSDVTVNWNVPMDTDNGIQGDATGYDVTFTLNQQ